MNRASTLGLAAAGLLLGASPPAQAQLRDPTPRIAVISAFAPEVTALIAKTEVEREVVVNGVSFTLGRLSGKEVVLFLSGISMVNATMNAQLALDNFDVQSIVFSGIAGGVNPDLNVGDVVVPRQWAQYLESVFARQTGENTWELPSFFSEVLPNFNYIFPQPVVVRRDGDTAGASKIWFTVDPDMLAVAKSIEADVEAKLRRCTDAGDCLAQRPRFKTGGNGVSGQAFVDNKAIRRWTFDTFQANVLDEESAAVATVAYANGTPFIVFRSLSDLAGGGPGENELGTFFQLAADNSAKAVTTFLKAWTPKE